MMLHNQQLSRMFIVVSAIFIFACSEQGNDGKPQATKAVPSVANVTEEKIARWQKEAQAGDADAKYNLAYIYENGLGVPKNEAKALELYQQAADGGHSAAKSNLDTMSLSK